MSLEEAKATLEPLLVAYDAGVERMNKDQNSDSAAVRQRAAAAQAKNVDKLARVLAGRDWPPQIQSDVAAILNYLNQIYPALEQASTTEDYDECVNLVTRYILNGAAKAVTSFRSLELKLGME